MNSFVILYYMTQLDAKQHQAVRIIHCSQKCLNAQKNKGKFTCSIHFHPQLSCFFVLCLVLIIIWIYIAQISYPPKMFKAPTQKENIVASENEGGE